ncbi:MAG: ATP-binding protein [Actinobacteria bacterium]|nr:MAG: ATP-binding protein [Actinomycetota bacterium]
MLAKRALTISAAGAHNMLMMGSPGAGKSMLAKRLPTIMPPLSKKEIIDITKIFSVAGLTNNGHNLIAKRPYRSPHHTISSAGLVGGGQSAKPGEISLSHLGVLFLDELTEFRRDSLECLRQPLEEGKISISRALRQNTYPANFCLIAAINPCRCGFYGDKVKQCLCTPSEIRRYKQKISGPLLERIDLHVNVDRLTKEELISYKSNEKSSEIRQIVIDAYSRQKKRFTKEKINLNSQMKPAHIKKYCQLNKESLEFISQAVDKLGLSGRSYDKILRVSRTIADLQSAEDIKTEHIAEAIQYRQYDRQNTFG